jgi:RNA polymerase sigma-70 factor, ECF subfamily
MLPVSREECSSEPIMNTISDRQSTIEINQSRSGYQLSDAETWVDQHGDYLFRYALLRLRNKQLAEEVVQETFLAALKARDKFAGQSSEKTWLVGILKHKVIDQFRKASKEVPLEESGVLPAEREENFRTTGEWVGHWKVTAAPVEWSADPIKLLEEREFRQALDECLASLPPRLAQVFILREIEEMSAEEICRTLNISESNLWVMLHRSRMQLRRSLELKYFRTRSV